MLPGSSLQHCTSHRKALAPSLPPGAAWRRMERKDIRLSSGQGWEGHRHMTHSLSVPKPKAFWLTDAKVIFHYLVGLRCKPRRCVPLSWFDIANNTELLIKSVFHSFFFSKTGSMTTGFLGRCRVHEILAHDEE